MLHLILAALGLGGLAAGIAWYLVGGAAILAFAKGMPKPVWYAIAAVAALVVVGVYHSRQVHSALNAAKAEQAAHDQKILDQTVANYNAAAREAEAKDRANQQRVQAEQQKINQESKDEYEARIDRARAAAGRLRAQLEAASHSGLRPGSPVPGVSDAPIRVTEAPGQGGFSVTDRLIATEQAIQLDELEKWVVKQATIDVNGELSQPKKPKKRSLLKRLWPF